MWGQLNDDIGFPNDSGVYQSDLAGQAVSLSFAALHAHSIERTTFPERSALFFFFKGESGICSLKRFVMLTEEEVKFGPWFKQKTLS